VTLAGTSAIAYAGVFAYSVTREPTLTPLIAPVAAFGALLLLFVLARRTDDLLGWAVLLNGIAYAGATIAHGRHVDEAAPLVGAALLLCAELAAWSLDERWTIRAERGVLATRLAGVAALCTAGLVTSSLVVALATSSVGGGLLWTVLGAAAAVGVVAVVRMARSE
jgi:hypothetical protein